MTQSYKMKKKIFAFVGSLAIILMPVVAFGQGTPDLCASTGGTTTAANGVAGVVCVIKNLVNTAIPILMAAAFLFFIIQVIKFVTSSDAEKRGDARNGMLQGIIGFACILGLWGLVNIILSTVGGKGSYNASDLPIF